MEIVKHLDKFDFEDRKNVQLLFTELYNNFADVMEETLDFEKEHVVRTLVDTYTQPGMSPFVGNLLRLYAKSSRLLQAFLHLDLLQKLTELITNPDFNISSDAYETFKEVFLSERAD